MADRKQEAKGKILIVDDSDYSRKQIIQILEKNNFIVVGEANSAKSALDLLGSTKANITIIDLVMPEQSGLELTKTIKENFHDINIIMTSSLKQENIIKESLSLGAQDFLLKPISEKRLIDAIQKVESTLKEE